MDGFRNILRKISGENKSASSTSSLSPVESLNVNGRGESGSVSSAVLPSNSSLVLATRPPRQVVSLWTCSKLCAICFVAGVVFGYTLKRRVRSWASKLLKKLKDN